MSQNNEKPIQTSDFLEDAPLGPAESPLSPDPSRRQVVETVPVPNPERSIGLAYKAKRGDRVLYAVSEQYHLRLEEGYSVPVPDPISGANRLHEVPGVVMHFRQSSVPFRAVARVTAGTHAEFIHAQPAGRLDFDQWFDTDLLAQRRDIAALPDDAKEKARTEWWHKVLRKPGFGRRFGTKHDICSLAWPLMPRDVKGADYDLDRKVNLVLAQEDQREKPIKKKGK